MVNLTQLFWDVLAKIKTTKQITFIRYIICKHMADHITNKICNGMCL